MIERSDDGTVVAAGSLDQPFALIGRDPYCDIHLNDPEVALRHAFLQVINGHVFVFDLHSPTGVQWPDGKQPSGWLNPGEPLTIGPFKLFLTRPAGQHPTVLASDFNPVLTPSDGPPTVNLEFRSGMVARSAWAVNRVLTIIGRANDCTLHLAGDDVANFHAYLLKTIAGYWVIDLRARGGVFVNDHKVRIALLQDHDLLKIGTFEIAVHYPKLKQILNEDSAVSFEVPMDDDNLRPESALLSNASARIGPPQPTMLAPDGALPAAEQKSSPAIAPVGGLEANLLAMVTQMGDMQAAMFLQFQQSLTMLMQMAVQLDTRQAPDAKARLAKMAELEASLLRFLGEETPPAEEPVPLTTMPPVAMPAMPWVPITDTSARHHEELLSRMTKMNNERQSLWKRLTGR
jgi:pSer/pThr/pTyr-binding forkhead associated (FHA) protein